MSQSMLFVRGLLGAVTVGALAVVAGCTTAPESEPTSKPSASAAPETSEPYAGPVAFIGDELEWFLLSPEEIAGVVPDATDISDPSAYLIQVADGGGGPEIIPDICGVLVSEPSLGSVGARSVTWQSPLGDEQEGGLHVLQYSNEQFVQERMSEYLDMAEQCADFTFGEASTFDSTVVESGDGVTAVAGSLMIDFGSGAENRRYLGMAAVGNVMVSLWQPFIGDSTFDAQAAAELLRDRLSEAQAKLISGLTETPPVPPEVPAADDASVPWSEWQISTAGVGPVRLGVELEEAIAAVPDAPVEQQQWWGAPTRLFSPDGAASILLWQESEGTAVQGISVGIANVGGEPSYDGSALPAARGVRVGDAVSSAISAFPEGTMMRVVSSGEFFYLWSTREGVLMSFRSDRDVTEEGALITGIRVEDATDYRP